jgi:PTH1 family peptidyl-tRNA hydrolase
MLLLVGLGNPGARYQGNRHNIGFMAVDEIVRRHGFSAWKKRFQGEVAEGSLGSERVLALKPQTFMNESGRAVGEAARFFKLDLKDVVVLYDELDLAPGKVRVKTGGGSAGHNGIRSIDALLGADFRRVRLGIGHPGDKKLVLHYVLSDFDRELDGWLKPTLDAVADAAPLLAAGDDAKFMTRVALLTSPPPDRSPQDKPAQGKPNKTPRA